MDRHSVIMCGLVFVCLSLIIPSLGASFTVCGTGEYRSKETGLCETCSRCPMNEIVRRPCSQFRDTSCGPFYEFEFFNQGNKDSEETEEGDEQSEDFNLFKFYSTKSPLLGEGSARDDERQSDNIKVDERIAVNVPYLKDDVPKWRELCYGLIGALTVITFLFVCYVAYTQVQMRKLNAACKLNNTQESREEPIYCYTQMFTSDDQSNSGKMKLHPSRSPVNKPGNSKRVNSPKSRALPNDYVMHLREANQTIPETSTEQNQLLPVIPEGSSTDSDHVRVLYTNQK